ncbi:hypothetical protein RQP46_002727 [Phenoliferia psychrophenolica]
MKDILLTAKYHWDVKSGVTPDDVLHAIMLTTAMQPDIAALVTGIVLLRETKSLHLLNTPSKGGPRLTPLQRMLEPFAMTRGIPRGTSEGDRKIHTKAYLCFIQLLLLAGSDPKTVSRLARACADPSARSLVEEYEKNEGCKWEFARKLLCSPPCISLSVMIHQEGLSTGPAPDIGNHYNECDCKRYWLIAKAQGGRSRCDDSDCRAILMPHQNMICGGCFEAKYCSRRCSKRDWKKHKALCKSTAAASSELELSALEEPTRSPTAALVSALALLLEGDPPLHFAITNALRLGTSRSLRRTHGFLVGIAVDLLASPGTPLAQRTKILNAVVKTFEKIAEIEDPKNLERFKDPECRQAFFAFIVQPKNGPHVSAFSAYTPGVVNADYLGWDPVGRVRRERSWLQDFKTDYARWATAAKDPVLMTQEYSNLGWERVWGPGREERSIVYAPRPGAKPVIAPQTVKYPEYSMTFLASRPSAKDLKSGKVLK